MGANLVGELREFSEAFRAMMADVSKQIRALEERLEKMERSKSIAYRGVFSPVESYDAGDYATHGGSLWCCVRDTSPGDAPGKSASWKLAAKG